MCLYGLHKANGYRFLLWDCIYCPENEKLVLLQARAEEMARNGPSRSNRSQRAASSQISAGSDPKPGCKVTGCLQPVSHPRTSSSFSVPLFDGTIIVTTTIRTDDGSDESTTVSPKLGESSFINGIGKLTKITPVPLQVTLKDKDVPQTFSFWRSWAPPRTTLKLSAGPLALVNITFLVADEELTAEDLLIGLPVLEHLGVDTKTLLEEKRNFLDGFDCSSVCASQSSVLGGQLSRLMIARSNQLPNSEDFSSSLSDATRPSVNYDHVHEEQDTFSDASLLDEVDSSQSNEVLA
eukprot:gb/GEZJ01004544.1/.p1 GENE.gb/GEZJ01004544.1/~~gb/GEZJ01004544.1/.p1  ORF type:complete len:294 (-),score=41.13 gb/GEZJ01004544.1/:342-1223(-)